MFLCWRIQRRYLIPFSLSYIIVLSTSDSSKEIYIVIQGDAGLHSLISFAFLSSFHLLSDVKTCVGMRCYLTAAPIPEMPMNTINMKGHESNYKWQIIGTLYQSVEHIVRQSAIVTVPIQTSEHHRCLSTLCQRNENALLFLPAGTKTGLKQYLVG